MKYLLKIIRKGKEIPVCYCLNKGWLEAIGEDGVKEGVWESFKIVES